MHGDALFIPELHSGYGWRPLGTTGMRCREKNAASEYSVSKTKRINPISGAIEKFIFVMNEAGREIMTIDPQIPRLAIPKVRDPPRVRPARLGDGEPLNIR